MTTLPLSAYLRISASQIKAGEEAIEARENPVFSYADRPHFDASAYIANVEGVIADLAERNDLHEVLRTLSINKQKELIVKAKYVHAIQTGADHEVTELSQLLYGDCEATSEELLNELRGVLSKLAPQERPNKVSPEEIAESIASALAEDGLSHWNVVIQPSTHVSVQFRKRNPRVVIPEGKWANDIRLKQLVAHEVHTHILRYERGVSSGIKEFATGTAGYLTTEEGLAIYRQEQSAPTRYLRPGFWQELAVALAKEEDFLGTYDALLEARRQFYLWIHPKKPKRALRMAHKSALRLALRSHAGITNTATPLAHCARGLVYSKGYTEVKAFFDGLNPQEQEEAMNILLVGKIGLRDIELVKRLPEELNPLINRE